jgi:peptidoglycan/LPS O-acetylase OafA/YrhL
LNLVDLAYIIVGTTLSFLAASLSFHLLEVHFLKLKDRLAPPL